MKGGRFLAGAFVGDKPGDGFAWDTYRQRLDQIVACGGTPIIFQSFGLTQQAPEKIIEAYTQIGNHIGDFYGFELGKVFASFGAIYSIELYEQLMHIPQCLGAKHSSLSRKLEWDRLELRDRVRPDFQILTGNDLAIDMVMYGSDYLLGLSTFAPEEFAARDAMWERGDNGFYELNDLLQYLGFFTFRPVPAYKHNAAQFLKARDWIETSLTYPGSPTRPATDVPILQEILDRLVPKRTPPNSPAPPPPHPPQVRHPRRSACPRRTPCLSATFPPPTNIPLKTAFPTPQSPFPTDGKDLDRLSLAINL